MQGQSCEIRQEKSKMSEQKDRETLWSQQENREMTFACQISWALVPAAHLSHKRSRTAGECVSCTNGQHNCPFTPPSNCHALASHQRMAILFVPRLGEKKSHQNKCSFHRDICRGQTSNWAHVQPTLASESRFAGSAGMLSSTVLVSTATTPTGIPPSLVTCKTNQNSYFYCYTTRLFFQFAPKYSRETNNASKWQKKHSGFF